MLTRLGQVLYWVARWKDSCFAIAVVAIAILMALGVPTFLAVMWGIVIGTPFLAVYIAVQDEKEWTIFWSILCFELVLIVWAIDTSI